MRARGPPVDLEHQESLLERILATRVSWLGGTGAGLEIMFKDRNDKPGWCIFAQRDTRIFVCRGGHVEARVLAMAQNDPAWECAFEMTANVAQGDYTAYLRWRQETPLAVGPIDIDGVEVDAFPMELFDVLASMGAENAKKVMLSSRYEYREDNMTVHVRSPHTNKFAVCAHDEPGNIVFVSVSVEPGSVLLKCGNASSCERCPWSISLDADVRDLCVHCNAVASRDEMATFFEEAQELEHGLEERGVSMEEANTRASSAVAMGGVLDPQHMSEPMRASVQRGSATWPCEVSLHATPLCACGDQHSLEPILIKSNARLVDKGGRVSIVRLYDVRCAVCNTVARFDGTPHGCWHKGTDILWGLELVADYAWHFYRSGGSVRAYYDVFSMAHDVLRAAFQGQEVFAHIGSMPSHRAFHNAMWSALGSFHSYDAVYQAMTCECARNALEYPIRIAFDGIMFGPQLNGQQIELSRAATAGVRVPDTPGMRQRGSGTSTSVLTMWSNKTRSYILRLINPKRLPSALNDIRSKTPAELHLTNVEVEALRDDPCLVELCDLFAPADAPNDGRTEAPASSLFKSTVGSFVASLARSTPVSLTIPFATARRLMRTANTVTERVVWIAGGDKEVVAKDAPLFYEMCVAGAAATAAAPTHLVDHPAHELGDGAMRVPHVVQRLLYDVCQRVVKHFAADEDDVEDRIVSEHPDGLPPICGQEDPRRLVDGIACDDGTILVGQEQIEMLRERELDKFQCYGDRMLGMFLPPPLGSSADDDHECNKKYTGAPNKNSYGLWVCSCYECGTMLGFQLMSSTESPHMLIRDLMQRCRNPNNVIALYDFACSAYSTAVKTFPNLFRDTRLLIDRFHFKEGHYACSDSFDPAIFTKAECTWAPRNTSVAEQVNSELARLIRTVPKMTPKRGMKAMMLFVYMRQLLRAKKKTTART